jgi:hypothetical protein
MTRPIDDLFGELSEPGRPLGPTDWAEPAELRKRAEHQQTVRRTAIASSLAVVAALAFAVPATIASHHGSASPAAAGLGAPTGAVLPPAVTFATPTPGTKIASPVLPGIAVPTGTPETYGPVSVVVPDGWTTATRSVGFGDPAQIAHSVCIAPPATAATRTVEDCAGLQIWYDGFLPGAGHLPYLNTARETLMAWHHTDSAATCPAAAGAAGSRVTANAGLTEDFQKVGAKIANHNAWQVTCADGSTFQPQGWLLPKTKVLIFSYLSDKQAQAILATAQFPAS